MVECFLPKEEVAGSTPVSRSMKHCEICEAIKFHDYTILETTLWTVSLDRVDQYYLGRSFVTTKRHVENLSDLTAAEWTELHDVIIRTERALRTGLGATMFNWSCLTNNAFQTKPFHPHVHWHLRPRYEKPVTLRGEVFVDAEFGHHYAKQTNRTVSDEFAREIVKRIQQALS